MTPADPLPGLSRAALKLEHAREERDRLIVVAATYGYSLRQIGDAAGLSHTGVSRILDRTWNPSALRDRTVS